MKAYRILVRDVRLAEPAELAAQMRDDARAREFARDRLAQSAYVSAVEVWSGRELICRLAQARQAA